MGPIYHPWRAGAVVAMVAMLLVGGIALIPQALDHAMAASGGGCQAGSFTEIASPASVRVDSLHVDHRWVVWSAEASAQGNDDDIYAYNVATGRTVAVATGVGYQDSPVIEGSTLVYRVLDLATGQTVLHEVNLTTRSDSILNVPIQALLTPQALAGGRLLVTADTLSGTPGGLYLVDLPNGPPVLLTQGATHGVALSPTTAVWVQSTSVAGNPSYELVAYDIAQGTSRVLLQTSHPIENPSISGSVVAFDEGTNRTTPTYVLGAVNLTTGASFGLALDRGPGSSLFAPQLDGNRVAYASAPPTQPTDVELYLLNLTTGTDRPLAFPGHPSPGGDLRGNVLAYPTAGAPSMQVLCLG